MTHPIGDPVSESPETSPADEVHELLAAAHALERDGMLTDVTPAVRAVLEPLMGQIERAVAALRSAASVRDLTDLRADAATALPTEARAALMSLAVEPKDAYAALWHFGERHGVPEPGSFYQALAAAIAAADPYNRLRLSYAFPGTVIAVLLAQEFSDGVARLRAIGGLDRAPV